MPDAPVEVGAGEGLFAVRRGGEGVEYLNKLHSVVLLNKRNALYVVRSLGFKDVLETVQKVFFSLSAAQRFLAVFVHLTGVLWDSGWALHTFVCCI